MMGADGWERRLDQAIEEVTGLQVAPEAGFFDAGLTSMNIIAVHDLLAGRHSVDVPVAVFFRHPTRRALAAHLARPPVDAAEPAVPVAARQRRGLSAVGRRELRTRIRQWRGDNGDR